MEDGGIFLKSLRDTSLNKDLSNEPTFGLIHLTGQYLLRKVSPTQTPQKKTGSIYAVKGAVSIILPGKTLF
jgi:hypothetical protein